MPAQESSDMLSNHDDLPLTTTPTFGGLPMDVRDLLLRMLPDEETLKAAVLSCKAFHDAYKSRKESIDKEVLDNRKAFEQRIEHRKIIQNLLSTLDALRRLSMRYPETERELERRLNLRMEAEL
ncbi:hypothetical protein SCHPADRAFT_998971 [Schizopora paradoxa]|uniref:Uncharacterized protein n=1 Tax=Schizopora paradoxa TaxID=27342 RepID=A0A0H2RHK2_9AGAM|nr:hypothetical protein SCHPADRAFT_998971 [Schizopora paradoxa]